MIHLPLRPSDLGTWKSIHQAKNIQKVPSADFETVYNLWQRYRNGQVTRPEIRDATRFSKYVISILYWLQAQCGGQLP